jgi:hypothetical protein
MPFSKDSVTLVGMTLSIEPKYGWGWRLTEGDKLLEVLKKVPEAFQAEVVDVLFDMEIARALLGKIHVEIVGRDFFWGYFRPHTDSTIDLRKRSVGCDILLSDTRPYHSQEVKYPDPRQVWSAGLQLRGYGEVALSPEATRGAGL